MLPTSMDLPALPTVLYHTTALALYAFLIVCSWRSSQWCRRRLQQQNAEAAAAKPPSTPEDRYGEEADDQEGPSAKLLSKRETAEVHRKPRRFCRFPRLLPPPVLIMLFYGVVTRGVLDLCSTLYGAGSREKEMSDTILATLLNITQPFFLFSLAVVGLEIGSHLSHAQLVSVKRPLLWFLALFVPIVYLGMSFWFRFIGDVLANPVSRQDQLRFALYTAERNAALKTYNETVAATVKLHRLSPISEQFISSYYYYIHRSVWCFAAVLATITLERSSPEFLSSMLNTGANDGFLPVFTLCITACQDVGGMLLFVVFSLFVKYIEADNLQFLKASIARFNEVWNTEAGRTHRAQDMPTQRTIIDLLKGGGSSLELLLSVALLTTAAVVTTLLVRRGLLRLLQRRLYQESPEAPPSRKASLVVLLCVAAVLALWGSFTHTELLLAAVITGSVVHFWKRCEVLHTAGEATQWASNVFLFTTVGLRASLLASANTAGQGPANNSFVQYIVWGVALFAFKVSLSWLGALAGSTAGGVPDIVALELAERDLKLKDEAVLDHYESELRRERRAALIAGVPKRIGFALLTQLAISLTLNNRANDEYDSLLAQTFPFLTESASAHSHAAKGGKAVARHVPFTAIESVGWEELLLPMRQITQAYLFAIVSAMIMGPILGAQTLRYYLAVMRSE